MIIDSTSSDDNCKIQNVCLKNNVGTLPTDCDQVNDSSDSKEYDVQPSLPVKVLEVVTTKTDSISSICRGEELHMISKHSDEGCAIDKGDESDSGHFTHETLVNSVINCECPSETAETMDNPMPLSGNLSSNSDVFINDLNRPTVKKIGSSSVYVSGDLQPANQCFKDENQENTIESNKNECFKTLVFDKTTPIKPNYETGNRAESDANGDDGYNGVNYEPNQNRPQSIFCSTPNVTRKLQDSSTNQTLEKDAPNFGLVSPLEVKYLRERQNLKRKYTDLTTIEEIDEDSNTTSEKKNKANEETNMGFDSIAPVETPSSSTLPCFEAPAKSLLKKWQPSCLSRNASANTFIVLDECGESDNEECSKPSQEHDSSRVDTFEIACQSLTELMKCSSDIEMIEKYHSQIQLENQMDDKSFYDILNETLVTVDFDDQLRSSVKSMQENIMVKSDDMTCNMFNAVEESDDVSQPGKEENDKLVEANTVSDNSTTVLGVIDACSVDVSDEPNIGNKGTGSKNIDDFSQAQMSATTNESSDNIQIKDKPSKGDGELKPEIDEEDFLLEENFSSKNKPYEFFEFVSTDPKENEDNYNPEWQKLGRLTTDEERYKAVRDRWRSLVPPNPNRNLTYRQWRTKNNKPPIRLPPLNNNHPLMDDNLRNQLCTAVFDNKIKKMVQELDDNRRNICLQQNREFETLSRVQVEEQRRATIMGCNYQQLVKLHNTHIMQCRNVKNQYDQELKRITDITQAKKRILKEAKEEILYFQKFYVGVGAKDDNEMYLTDIQVQELMETEEMLEQYKVFYK